MSFEDGRYFGEYFQSLKSKIKKKYNFKNIGEKRAEIKKIAKEIKKRSGFSLSDVAINKIFLDDFWCYRNWYEQGIWKSI